MFHNYASEIENMHLFVDLASYFSMILRLFYLLTGTYFQQAQIMGAPNQYILECCGRALNEEVRSMLSFSKCSFWNTDVSFDRDLFYGWGIDILHKGIKAEERVPVHSNLMLSSSYMITKQSFSIIFPFQRIWQNFLMALMWGFSTEFIHGQTLLPLKSMAVLLSSLTVQPTIESVWKFHPKLVAQPC